MGTGTSTSRQQAMTNGNCNRRVAVCLTECQGIPEKIAVANNNHSYKDLNGNLQDTKASNYSSSLVPVKQFHAKNPNLPVKPLGSNFDFNFSPKPKAYQTIPKSEFYSHRPVPVPSTPACKKLVYLHKPVEKIQTNNTSKVNTFAAGHTGSNKVALAGKSILTHKPLPNNDAKESNVTVSGTDSEIKKKKLIIRGLKRFCESRGSSCPPTWVKEFPCKSKYHPDNYLYDWEEGPYAAKRNTALMNKCLKKGGRCGTCGIYAVDVCRLCRKCDLDCGCPKLPKIPDFVNQLLGGDTSTWTQPQRTPRDFAGEEAMRNYNSTNYYPQPPQQMPMYGYSNMPPPPPVYPGYMYYPPNNYPPMYPGYLPPPMGYMPMPIPMMNQNFANPSVQSAPYYNNSYMNPANPVSERCSFPPPTNSDGNLTFTQPDNNVSVNMSFYDPK